MTSDEPKATVATSSSITGRTVYDAAVEIVQMLGRAAPWFIFVVAIFYGAQKLYEANQSKLVAVKDAQEQATLANSKEIQDLNSRLQENSKALETIRSQQLDGLKQIISLSDMVTTAVAKSQSDLIAQRDALFAAQDKVKQAERARDQAQQEIQQLQRQRAELQAEAAKAENTIDAATRFLAYLGSTGAPDIDRTSLSRRFENNDPARISRDESGAVYYGTFRIPGAEMTSFISYLDRQQPAMAARLNEVGGASAGKEGTAEFRTEWQSLTQDKAFEALQVDWIEATAYQPFIDRLKAGMGKYGAAFDIDKRSVALQAALWSVVLQHGRNTPLVRRAWTGIDVSTADDETLICRIYTERRKLDVYYPNAPAATISLLTARYVLEEQEALRMLQAQTKTDIGKGCVGQ
jgi:hypothetical protein